jgi:tetratricopeptide (TPR) repeat protein
VNTKSLRPILALTFLWAFANTLSAQAPNVEFPAASPAGDIKQRLGLTDVEIVYSRPGVKGRTIFGSLVPYDKVWRTGANNATKITFSTPVKINGAEIPAGAYSLFTIPGENEWTIIINKNAGQSGLQYDEKADVVRVKAAPVKLAEAVETFTIEFNGITDESAVLNLVWEKTSVPIKLEVELAGKLVPQIEAVMASDAKNKPYYQAAMFYYDHGQDLEKARKWVDAAIAEREAHYIVYLKAKILAKLGDKEGAIAAAKRSSELAIKANDPGYVKMNEDLISSLK